jgi:hypothetical protein
MINHVPALAGAALLAASLATFTNAASARPFSGALAACRRTKDRVHGGPCDRTTPSECDRNIHKPFF